MGDLESRRLNTELKKETARRVEAERKVTTHTWLSLILAVFVALVACVGAYSTFIKAPSERMKARAEAVVLLHNELINELEAMGLKDDAATARATKVESVRELLRMLQSLKLSDTSDARVDRLLVRPQPDSQVPDDELAVEQGEVAISAEKSDGISDDTTSATNRILYGTLEVAWYSGGTTSSMRTRLMGKSANDACTPVLGSIRGLRTSGLLSGVHKNLKDLFAQRSPAPDESWVSEGLAVALFDAPNASSKERAEITTELRSVFPPDW